MALQLHRRRRDRPGAGTPVLGGPRAGDDPRYAIAPQLADYDAFAARSEWRPYLMYGHAASFRSPAVNTDRHGLRRCGADPLAPYGIDDVGPERCSVIVGASTVFGVGATADHQTIPAHLERRTGHRWLNLGMRAYTTTQELMLFQAHFRRTPRLDRIVVMSGLNDLFTLSASWHYDETFGAFNGSDHFYGQLEPAKVDGLAAPDDYGALVTARLAERLDIASAILDRNLTVWSALARAPGVAGGGGGGEAGGGEAGGGLAGGVGGAGGVEVVFCLQPTFTWSGKVASPAERGLFDILDGQRNPNWQFAAEILRPERHAWLEDVVRTRCAALGVRFHDLNPPVGARSAADAWLWVDRVHLTDDGNALVADVLVDEGIAA